MLRAQLGEILGVAEQDIPSWYLDSNPHLIMRIADLNTTAASPVAKMDMKHAFDSAMAQRAEEEAQDAAHEYKAYALIDQAGNRSSIAVAHNQSTGGRGALPALQTYRQVAPAILNLPILQFKTAITSDWINGIGRPCDLTINEETADVVFPGNTVRSKAGTMSVDDVCDALKLCYFNRPAGNVLVAMMNKKRIKAVIAVPFDSLGTTRTTAFDCLVEPGDQIKYCSQLTRDDYDGRRATVMVMQGEAPSFFKWHSRLIDVFK